MSNLILFTNNASSLLASGITNSATSLAVTAGQGSLFPSPGANQIAVVTVEDTSGNIEVMWCTGRTGDTLTVTRAQEGTTAQAFASGSRVELRVTAGILGALLQKTGGDTLSGTTSITGVLQMGSSGSLQGCEYAGGYLRSAAGVTAGQIYVSAGVPMSGTATILTNTNIGSNLPSGADFCHTGMIVIWSGSSATVPTGWHICDGTNGTPNLEDQFVLGAGGALPTSGGTSSLTIPSVGLSGSVDGTALAINQMPAHTHNSELYQLGASAGGSVGVASNISTYGGSITPLATSSQGGGATHTHTVTALTTNSQTVNPLPPYKALFYIMKL